MSLSTKWLVAAIYLASLSLSADNPPGTCYYPGLQDGLGDVAEDYFPCDDTQYEAQCCPKGYTCFSNLLCMITDPRGANSSAPVGTVKRASCTNARWQNTICGNFCLGTFSMVIEVGKYQLMPNVDAANKFGAMSACGNDTYCCSADEVAGTCSCATGKGTISIPQGTVQNVISLAAPYQTSTTTPQSSKTPTSSSTGTSTTTPPQPSEAKSAFQKHKGAIIGGAVAGGVVLLLLIGALLLCVLKKRRPQYIPPKELNETSQHHNTYYTSHRDPDRPNIIVETDR
jgi:hypothetical protein